MTHLTIDSAQLAQDHGRRLGETYATRDLRDGSVAYSFDRAYTVASRIVFASGQVGRPFREPGTAHDYRALFIRSFDAEYSARTAGIRFDTQTPIQPYELNIDDLHHTCLTFAKLADAEAEAAARIGDALIELSDCRTDATLAVYSHGRRIAQVSQ